MQKKRFKIALDHGLYSKTATTLINLAMNFHCEITLKAFHKEIDFKSVMGVMSLGIYGGTEIEIVTNGIDEKDAILAMTEKILELKLATIL